MTTVQEVLAILAGHPGMEAVRLLKGLACERTARTGDKTMTAAKTPAEKAFTTNMIAAKKSLKLIADEAARHAELLAQNQVPDTSFLPSAQAYHEKLAVLRVLGKLGAPPALAYGLIEVPFLDVQLLIELVRAFVPTPALTAGAGALLGELEAVIATAQAPADGQGS